ncbi:MAG: monooxygenase [Blastococcus sp.]|nr:monooxygenase [Blastococcus sp.]
MLTVTSQPAAATRAWNGLIMATLTEDEQTIRRMVADAELPPLLAALAHLTGDMSLIRPEFRPPLRSLQASMEPQGGMTAEAQAAAREAAVAALVAYRDSGCPPAGTRSPEEIHELMKFLTGGAGEEYLSLLDHELSLGIDVGAPAWRTSEIAPETDFRVVVIGAGMSGIAAAHRLAQAEVPFVVLEKNADVGGTWLENNYPGCRLDTNNFAYSYSFAQRGDWPQQFSAQSDIRDYFQSVATELGLRDKIQFGTEVLSATWDEKTATWDLRIRTDGTVQTLTAHAVISAVGQLNRPNYPDIPGIDSFQGLSLHSARWDPALDLSGRRVAVIGTGASAYQIVPSIVDQVGELVVFQRNAPWMLPTPGYHENVATGLAELFERIPAYHQWFRFWQFWIATEGRLPLVEVDPEWKRPESVSARNEQLRIQLLDRLKGQYADRPDLYEKVVPTYPPGAKRMLRDNGVWAAALQQPHVSLVTEGIAEVTPTGVRTADGVLHEVDVIVYATGFTASDFLAPMRITGRDGMDLHEHWAGDARAHLGIDVPGFPNLFMLYGPNTNLVVTGSIIYMSECATEYILECLRLLLEGGHRAMECRPDAYDTYNDLIDRENRAKAWGASEVTSWYKNAKGRVTQNWPFPLLTYWQMTRKPDPSQYDIR